MSSFKPNMTRLALKPLVWLGRQPLPRARAWTRWLARPLRWLMRRRARIVQRNLELCFPELDSSARSIIYKQHFHELAEALGETAFAWRHDGRLNEAVGQVLGLDNIIEARSKGHGVIMLTGHTTCLELGARVLGEAVPSSAVYRPLRNPELEAFQNEGRRRYAQAMLPRHDIRAMIRHLRTGGVLWTAMDQDFGPNKSVFVPFFGIPTATATGLIDLARLARARVVPVYAFKDESSGRICIEIEPAFDPFPSGDAVVDLALYNAFLERSIRRAPAQYWWLHRRFKTAPADESPRYQC